MVWFVVATGMLNFYAMLNFTTRDVTEKKLTYIHVDVGSVLQHSRRSVFSGNHGQLAAAPVQTSRKNSGYPEYTSKHTQPVRIPPNKSFLAVYIVANVNSLKVY